MSRKPLFAGSCRPIITTHSPQHREQDRSVVFCSGPAKKLTDPVLASCLHQITRAPPESLGKTPQLQPFLIEGSAANCNTRTLPKISTFPAAHWPPQPQETLPSVPRADPLPQPFENPTTTRSPRCRSIPAASWDKFPFLVSEISLCLCGIPSAASARCTPDDPGNARTGCPFSFSQIDQRPLLRIASRFHNRRRSARPLALRSSARAESALSLQCRRLACGTGLSCTGIPRIACR